MALGRRRSRQQEMWVATTSLPKSEGHVFYRKLNEILAEAGFDRWVEETPDHSSLTRVRDRLPLEVHASVFQWVLKLAAEKGLLRGKTVAVDATTLEANAAMKTIVRRDFGRCHRGPCGRERDRHAAAVAPRVGWTWR